MQYVVCYDVADDVRRQRIATALLDYGTRIQESVFVANLEEELVERMVARVEKLIAPLEDRVHVFVLCGACAGKVRIFGRSEMPEDKDYYIL